MFKNKTAAGLIIAAIIIGSSSLAFGFGPEPGRGHGEGPEPGKGPEKFIERIGKDLELTKQQQDKLLTEAKQGEKEAGQIRSKNKDLFDKIEKELLKDSPDRDLLHNYIQQISQNNAQMEMKRMDQMIDLRKELTPAQKAKLEKIMKDRKEKEKKMFKRFGHGEFRRHGGSTAEAK